LLFYELLISFFSALIPAFLVISIIYYNKRVATKRARTEESILELKKEDEDYFDFSFGRGSFVKTILFLTLAYITNYTFILTASLGLLSDLMVGTFCAIFYLVLFLMMYYLPDKAEIELWKKRKKEKTKYEFEPFKKELKILDINSFIILFIIIAIIIGIGFLGTLSTNIPPFFNKPLERVFYPLVIIGIAFLGAGILLIIFLEKKENEGIKYTQIQWSQYSLDKYQIIKGFSFGSALFLHLFFSWTIWAYFMKFPMPIGPHSPFYMIMMFALILFFGGFQVMMKILKEKFLKDSMTLPEKLSFKGVAIELLTVIFGTVLCFIVIYITFFPLFSSSLFGNLTVYLALLLAFIYLLTNVIKIFCVDRGIFGITVFFPLFIFGILGFLLHI